MSNYNWCHNPECHTIETQSRIRGTGDNKVLRTVKIKEYPNRYQSIFNYFCNNGCLFQFLNKFARDVANLNPTLKPKETPIKVKKETYDTHRYRYTDKGYERYKTTATRTMIKGINE